MCHLSLPLSQSTVKVNVFLGRYVFDKKKNLAKTEIAITMLGGVDEGRRIHPYTYPVLNSSSFKLVISPLVCKFIYDHIISGGRCKAVTMSKSSSIIRSPQLSNIGLSSSTFSTANSFLTEWKWYSHTSTSLFHYKSHFRGLRATLFQVCLYFINIFWFIVWVYQDIYVRITIFMKMYCC